MHHSVRVVYFYVIVYTTICIFKFNSAIMKTSMKEWFLRFKAWLQGLSFRTGVIVLASCIPFYILSFTQMAISSQYLAIETKGVLWVALFGMAKACQYGGLTILGMEGYKRVKGWLRGNR